MTTLVNSGNDYIKAIISLRILGIAVIVLKGLNTRITLRALSYTDPKKNSIIPDMITIKSIKFQPVLRYDS